MTLSDQSIKNPVFAWMLMIGLIAFGAIAFTRMGISQMPDVDFPVINVSVTLEGAAPEVIETEVTDILEDAIMSVEGVKEVTSASRQGSANVTIEFDLNKDIDIALQEVQTKMAQAQRQLPDEIDPPVITKTNPEDQPIMWVALSGERPLREMMDYTKDILKDQFTTVSGVGEVFLGGYVEPSLRVWLDANKMNARELTVDDIIQAIQNQHAEVPAGRIETDRKELNVRVMGEASSVEEFQRIVIPTRQGQPIWNTFRIGDVGWVEDGLDDVRRISRVQGQRAVGMGIRKQRGSNAVEVAKGVRAKVAALQKDLPKELKLDIVFDSTKFIEESTHELNLTLFYSAVLTALVCWLFLGSLSSTINIILAIPTSIVGSFIFLYFFGFTLNTFTLLGLSLAIGIVVDDAIMVLENIVRYREQGLPKVRAAIIGAREITSAAVAATIAILAIFVPVIFMKGIIGKFLFQYGVTLTVAVGLSLIEALTIAPMRCSQFLEVGHTSWIGRTMDRLMDGMRLRYERLLTICLAWRWTVLIVAALIFAGSLWLVPGIKKELVPSQDQSRFMVRIQTPVGTSLAGTDKVFRLAEELIMKRPDVSLYFAAIGGFGGSEVNTGNMFVTMKNPKDRPKNPDTGKRYTQADLMAYVRKEFNKLPGVQRAIVQDLSQQGFSAQRGFPVEFSLVGSDWKQLESLSAMLLQEMQNTGLMTDIDTDYQLGQPEVRVHPDRVKAAARGVSISSIGNAINATIGGIRVGKYTKAGKRYDIRTRFISEDRQSAQDLSRIWIRNNRGEVIRLTDVVKSEIQPTLLSITRKNRQRAIRLFANVAPGKSQGEALTRMQQIAKEKLPEGYRIVLSGSAQTSKESFESLLIALVLGVFVAYMVLASQYNSFLHPLIVLLALPFSLTGAFMALRIGGYSLNMFSMIGIVLLMGIVKKNSILLVDFTNERRKHGLDVGKALLEACPIRLRPIIMTSMATITAAIPPALGFGPGAETRVPMALVIIGGVAVSTFLTLFVVPCAYSLLSRLESHTHDHELQEALTELGELPVQKRTQ